MMGFDLFGMGKTASGFPLLFECVLVVSLIQSCGVSDLSLLDRVLRHKLRDMRL